MLELKLNHIDKRGPDRNIPDKFGQKYAYSIHTITKCNI